MLLLSLFPCLLTALRDTHRGVSFMGAVLMPTAVVFRIPGTAKAVNEAAGYQGVVEYRQVLPPT